MKTKLQTTHQESPQTPTNQDNPDTPQSTNPNNHDNTYAATQKHIYYNFELKNNITPHHVFVFQSPHICLTILKLDVNFLILQGQ